MLETVAAYLYRTGLWLGQALCGQYHKHMTLTPAVNRTVCYMIPDQTCEGNPPTEFQNNGLYSSVGSAQDWVSVAQVSILLSAQLSSFPCYMSRISCHALFVLHRDFFFYFSSICPID